MMKSFQGSSPDFLLCQNNFLPFKNSLLFNHSFRQIPQGQGRTTKYHKSKFTKIEDEKLKQLVSQYGDKEWSLISKQMNDRNPRQCRERWFNYLCPKLTKEEWTMKEDYLLIKKFNDIGPHWNIISKSFINRSVNSVRNRYVKLANNYLKNLKKSILENDMLNKFKSEKRADEINFNFNECSSQESHNLNSIRNQNKFIAEKPKKIEENTKEMYNFAEEVDLLFNLFESTSL